MDVKTEGGFPLWKTIRVLSFPHDFKIRLLMCCKNVYFFLFLDRISKRLLLSPQSQLIKNFAGGKGFKVEFLTFYPILKYPRDGGILKSG
jgi:hypothetical protein